jgi:hypothetical protein
MKRGAISVYVGEKLSKCVMATDRRVREKSARLISCFGLTEDKSIRPAAAPKGVGARRGGPNRPPTD